MNLKTLSIFISLAAFWGSSFMFMRIAGPSFGSFALAFMRVLIAAIFLTVLTFALRKPFLQGVQLRWALLIGVINSAIPFTLFAYATQSLPAGYTAVLNATVPFWGLGIGAIVFKEQLAWHKLLALFVAICGLAMMLGLGAVELNVTTLKAIAACLLASLMYGISGHTSKRKLAGVDSYAQSLAAMLGGSIVLAPLALWQWPAVMPGAGDWAAVIVLGMLCSGLAYILYFWLIEHAGLNFGLSVTLLIPVFGVFWGMVFLHERLTLLSALGGGITLLATAVVIGVLPLKKTSV
jgi:drug/metabolite transporter (DMT)-like permease